jgi:hypothetical protein
MFLAGTYVNDNDLLVLARGLRVRGRMESAERFEHAYFRDVRLLDLSPEERADLLDVLGSRCSPTLRPLQAALQSV